MLWSVSLRQPPSHLDFILLHLVMLHALMQLLPLPSQLMDVLLLITGCILLALNHNILLIQPKSYRNINKDRGTSVKHLHHTITVETLLPTLLKRPLVKFECKSKYKHIDLYPWGEFFPLESNISCAKGMASKEGFHCSIVLKQYPCLRQYPYV